jgi:hypothetical protein
VAAMPDRETLELVQKIDELLERAERARDLVTLRLMKIRIKIAKLEAELKEKRRSGGGE